jgi:hypothetical protein
MTPIVRDNNESVSEKCMRNGGKEVKMFTGVLQVAQCRRVMTQRTILDDFLRGKIIGCLECECTQM